MSDIFDAEDILNLLVSGINKTTLETELTASNWISTPARGGSKSGSGMIWTSPDNQSSMRIMTQSHGSSYARVYNGPGGGAPGEQPLNAFGQPGTRAETHFNLLIENPQQNYEL
ncbi:MAG: hypothetical protein EA343_11390 [Nodularia sp. (in: Bacteria)]|nr:MAG: hypothetical protein EA343_11390 [Nodularia sp. (in: cyanobacteria)]